MVYEDVTSWLDSGCTVDVVLFDFSKAFDVVSLLEINSIGSPIGLSAVGVSRCLLDWIEDFLVGRMMCVSVSGKKCLTGLID